jgi:hypothetical protein
MISMTAEICSAVSTDDLNDCSMLQHRERHTRIEELVDNPAENEQATIRIAKARPTAWGWRLSVHDVAANGSNATGRNPLTVSSFDN